MNPDSLTGGVASVNEGDALMVESSFRETGGVAMGVAKTWCNSGGVVLCEVREGECGRGGEGEGVGMRGVDSEPLSSFPLSTELESFFSSA